MLVAAAVCPCPPLLVPEVAAGAAPELDAARTVCSDALSVLAAARPDRLVVVGPAEQAGRGPYPEGARGSFRGFGVDLTVRLGRDGGDAQPGRDLPPSLAVGAWLLERAGWSAAPVEGLGVGEPLGAERCVEVGREIGAMPGRVALLVMGDSSACRTLKAPGYLDERAAPFDAEVARALGTADVTALQALDAELAHELKASGRAPWQVLAGAAEDAGLTGALLYEDAPYGVGYVVAAWS
ncbi:class III extradiol dioxygenase subunit B-like domain-containing protein [Streptomyces soliscabiei]|uniref:class III extradiol dioxygenase subunit B-like domain-containing protein n=1 Tax=Streptomyces soliscabiei TaxID=588897 RepID=UPI0029B7B23C|nr:class III extradiol dioxygenase subunit B-like domain-containing protein [Streptomyces sp. NY05-11A]MDX2680737.1 class III extradiol dioxygenase subunit B-like domain-containing protein [Streptomyces sp. NY05-11A]